MNMKHSFFALITVALVTACSNVTEINRAKSDTGPLKLNNVIVSTDETLLRSQGRDIGKSTAEFRADLTAALAKELGPYSDPNGLPADVKVKVDEVFLARIVDRALVGTSYIDSTITVVDAETGEEIVAPTKVRGDSNQLRAAGPIGAITTQSLAKDYQSAINGYAKALAASLVASK